MQAMLFYPSCEVEAIEHMRFISMSPFSSSDSILSSDTLKQSYHIVSHQILTG